MAKQDTQDYSNSGWLKLFEQGKSWTDYWAALTSEALCLYKDQKSSRPGSTEARFIPLTAILSSQAQKGNSNSFQFNVYVDSSVLIFKCNSALVRDQWLCKLALVCASFCQKSCFHCYEPDCSQKRDISGSVTSQALSISSRCSSEVTAGSENNDALNCSNNSKRHRSGTGGETVQDDRVTSPSLKLFGSEENILSSFSKSSNVERTQSETELENNTFIISDSKPTKRSTGSEHGSLTGKDEDSDIDEGISQPEPDNHVSTSSLKLFDTQDSQFSTFAKRLSWKKRRNAPGFANPIFVVEDAVDAPEIPDRISKVFEAPLNYDVPTLSRRDTERGYLKVLTGKKNWKRYRATIEKSQLLLSDPENDNSETRRIDLKPVLQFTLLPRRTHDYRFKMTTGTAMMYFFKCPTVFQRDQWIEAMTAASRTVCQNTCPRCCSKYPSSSPSVTGTESTDQVFSGDEMVTSPDEEADDVFYVKMTNENKGITFGNPLNNSELAICNTNEGKCSEIVSDRCDEISERHCGYLKTNAVGKQWKNVWAVIKGRKLFLYPKKNDPKEVKIIELLQNVQCQTAKRKSHSFRFTLIAGATSSYEFKCSSARDRNEWMTALKEVEQENDAGTNDGSRNDCDEPLKVSEKCKREEVIGPEAQRNGEGSLGSEWMQREKQQQQQQQAGLYEVVPLADNATERTPSQQQDQVPGKRECYETILSTYNSIEEFPPPPPTFLLSFPLPPESGQRQFPVSPPPRPTSPPPPPPQREKQPKQNEGAYYDAILSSNNGVEELPPFPTLPPPLPPSLKPPPPPPEQRQQQKDGAFYDAILSSDNGIEELPPLPPDLLYETVPPIDCEKRNSQNDTKQSQLSQSSWNIEEHVLDLPTVRNGEYNVAYEGTEIHTLGTKTGMADGRWTENISYVVSRRSGDAVQSSKKTDDGGERNEGEDQGTKEAVGPWKENVSYVVSTRSTDIIQSLEETTDAREEIEKTGLGTKEAVGPWKENVSYMASTRSPHVVQSLKETDDEGEMIEEKPQAIKEAVGPWKDNVNYIVSMGSHGAIQLQEETDEEKHGIDKKKWMTNEKEGKNLSLKTFEDNVGFASNDCVQERGPSLMGGSDNDDVIDEPAFDLGVQDFEKFISDVLGKVDLPPDVNKQRLELSGRLRKLLNRKDETPKKSPLPPPVEDEPTFYDDVMGNMGGLNAGQEQGKTENDWAKNVPEPQETYDDVKPEQTANKEVESQPEETYDDVKPEGSAEKQKEKPNPDGSSEKTDSDTGPEEMYDDIKPETDKSDTVSRLSLDTVGEPVKPSDIKDKIYVGYLEKYKTKGLFKLSKWQRRYCVLTPLALYYYTDPKDAKQKGTIVLPGSGCTLRKGHRSCPEVKEGRLCFELGGPERWYLFRAEQEALFTAWIKHINTAFQTKLSEEQSQMIRTRSIKIARSEKDDVTVDIDEDLYEPVETFRKEPSSSSAETEPVQEEMYEETDQYSAKESSAGSSVEAPALPSRRKPSEDSASQAVKNAEAEQEPEPEETYDDVVKEEIKELTEEEEIAEQKTRSSGDDVTPSVPSRQPQPTSESPKLPPRPGSSQAAPQLPPRTGAAAQTSKPPVITARTTPPSTKKAPLPLPSEVTPPSPPVTHKKEPVSAPAEVSSAQKPEVVPRPSAQPPPIKVKPKGEQFDYARVYVALWNCEADDEEDLTFSRGNQLYIREKIPNSDWWVASLMDSPEIRVGLVPRNYIMPAYQL